MKTVIITLLLTAASVMSCKPPMPPTDNESACTSSCKQDQRTADVIGEADIITWIASDDFPSLFIQGNHFQFQRKNGLYAPLGIGFMEVIAEQNPVIPLYRTATCKEPEDSIALHCISIRLTRILPSGKGRMTIRRNGRTDRITLHAKMADITIVTLRHQIR